jgi:hypothetical protein
MRNGKIAMKKNVMKMKFGKISRFGILLARNCVLALTAREIFNVKTRQWSKSADSWM